MTIKIIPRTTSPKLSRLLITAAISIKAEQASNLVQIPKTLSLVHIARKNLTVESTPQQVRYFSLGTQICLQTKVSIKVETHIPISPIRTNSTPTTSKWATLICNINRISINKTHNTSFNSNNQILST